jgi:elongator complex protein 2
VERAFLPSLGLSNKATAECEQESAKYAGPTNDDDFVEALDTVESGTIDELKLPSERDLGVTTLWPETRKLFGHESELVCLDAYRAPEGTDCPSLIASSCKARNDVASAAIRLWNVKQGKCVDILKVRSTIWDRREYHLFYARYLMIIVYNRAGIDRQYQRCRFQVMVDIW